MPYLYKHLARISSQIIEKGIAGAKDFIIIIIIIPFLENLILPARERERDRPSLETFELRKSEIKGLDLGKAILQRLQWFNANFLTMDGAADA